MFFCHLCDGAAWLADELAKWRASLAQKPTLVVGLVADVQAASQLADKTSEGRLLRYSTAPSRLEKATDEWIAAAAPAGSTRCLDAVIQLGDLIDGSPTRDAARADLRHLAAIFDRLPCPVYHVVGNHCLKEISRDELRKTLRMDADYYRVDLCEGWRLLVLDTTELSLHGRWPRTSRQNTEANEYYAAHKGEPRMQTYNGGAGRMQMDWLHAELAAAEMDNCRVIVASHHPTAHGSARETHRSWTGDEIAKACAESSAFVLALSGHDHVGGYATHLGKPFVTLEAMLESDDETNAYGWLKLFPDRIEIEGRGNMTSRTFKLKK